MANPADLVQGSAGVMVAAFAGCVYKALQLPPAADSPAATVHALGPVFVVTAAWVCLLYIWLFNQSVTAFAEHRRLRREAKAEAAARPPPRLADVKYGTVPSPRMLVANRTVGNYLEQALPFLVALYTHAALVSVRGAVRCGWLYLLMRSYYPLAFQRPFPALLMSTVPSYLVVGYLLITALRTL